MSLRTQAQTRADRFLLGHAEAADWEKAAESCLQQIGYISADANLGFLYVTDGHASHLKSILDHFRNETGIQDWVGTVGMGICASGTEYYSTPAMAVLLGSFPAESFRILPTLRDAQLGELLDIQEWLQRGLSHFGVVHGDPRNGNTPELIEHLAERLPGGYLVGGLTSSRGEEVQIANGIIHGGLSGVIFSDAVDVVTGLTQGCSPIAGKHVITACERNIIARIDDRPALDVFYEDIGEILARDLNRVAGYIFAGLPIADSDRGDYLVRNLIGVDTKNKLLAIGDLIEPGQPLQFCRRDGR
ncbi:MAG: FIST C-terminal domain-containing protein, partial [Gammaproteobacteria bacterium]|nr:FIST C-terminal domain-containing protein [Gammaproteobacteria bacterium]